ncbi:MAG: ferrous iron transport protein A [Clostridiales bacterium]|nr:ferrous iron transport protein A [Clostridiales bacterium]
MPLTFAQIGEENVIRKIGGNTQVRSHLEHLGFVPGGLVEVVSSMGGNLIVNIKGSRVAISQEMANKILI